MKMKIICLLTLLIGIQNFQSCGGKEGLDDDADEYDDALEGTITMCSTSADLTKLDPLAGCAWHLNNIGQSAFAENSGVLGFDLNLKKSLESYKLSGKGVKIAISDSGLEIAHEDLSANVLVDENRNYLVGSLSNNYAGDPTNDIELDGDHGTSVAGIIAAVDSNKLGSRGVASKASIAGFNFLQSGNDDMITVNQADGDFDIFNQSFGLKVRASDEIGPSYLAQLQYGVTKLRNGLGAIYVKAVGNGFNEGVCGNSDPWNTTPYTIVVPAVNAHGKSSTYSSSCSCNLVSGFGGEYGVKYPAIITTDQSGCVNGYSHSAADSNYFNQGSENNPNCSYTSTFNGSSSAAPMVTGAVALLLEANPKLTWRDVRHILITTAKQIDPDVPTVNLTLHNENIEYVIEQGWVTNAAGFSFHNWYGFGVVDIDAAVEKAKNYTEDLGNYIETIYSDTNTWVYEQKNLSIPIPDYSSVGATNEIEVKTDLVIESVQLRVSAEHVYSGDLGIELISPSGTKSILLNAKNHFQGADHLIDLVTISNAFYGESSLGTWKIKLVDLSWTDSGTLLNWAIKINGRSPAPMTFTKFCGGIGTSDKPFQLCTAEQFASIGQFSGKHFIVNNDIDLVGSLWEIPEDFSGSLDGQNFKISNLTPIKTNGAAFVIKNTGTIKNINFVNFNITCQNDGCVALENLGTISNVFVSSEESDRVQ